MKYLKTYEDLDWKPFYNQKLYWFEILINRKISNDDIIGITKEVINVLEERNSDYRLYYHTADKKDQSDSIVILTPEPVEYFELPKPKGDMSKEFVELKDDDSLPANIMDKYRIELDDLEIIFNSKKYNI